MTREECLDWLYRLRGEIYVYIQPKEWLIPMNNALDMAIKALEQEPCIKEKQANADKIDAVYIDGFKAGYSQARFDLEQKPCEDCVSRQAVLDKIRAEIKSQIHTEYIPYTGGYESRTLQADSVLKIIDKYKEESEDKE